VTRCRKWKRLFRELGEKENTLKLKSDVRCRSVAGEGIIVCQEKAEVLVVNGVGARILELVQREMSFEEIVQKLQEEYEVESSDMVSDVRVFIEELDGAGVLDPAST